MPKKTPHREYLLNFYRQRMADKKCPMKLRFEAADRVAELGRVKDAPPAAPAPPAEVTPPQAEPEKLTTLERMRRRDAIPNSQSSSS